MAKIYFDDDADISFVQDKTIAILGYGNQGRSQALNLRDNGMKVVVGNIDDEYAESARADGWDLMTLADAAAEADILMMLTSDESQPEVYQRDVLPTLKEGDLMSFAHGFNVYYEEIVAEPTTDVVMVAPRMLGEGVRATFVEGRSFPSFIAVHQDASGQAHERTLALSKAIGSTKMGVIESSFEEETLMDLFEEHQTGLHSLRAMFDALIEAGCSPEAIIMELYASGESVKFEEYARDVGHFRRMKRASQTAQFGHMVWAGQHFDREAAMDEFRAVIGRIKDRSFYNAYKEQKQKNMKALDETWKEVEDTPLAEAEETVFKLLGRR